MSEDFYDKVLRFLGLNSVQYEKLIQPATSDQLIPFSSYPESERFLACLHHHLDQQHTMIIYGDYDADGMFSSSILYDTLIQLGANVSVYLPQRYQDGYGLTIHHAKRYVEAGYQLVLCIDNGVSQHDAIQYLHEHDVDVLVLDHHQVSPTPPPYQALIHPEHHHPFPLARCSGSLALSLSIHLLQRVEPKHVVYAAIATMTDGMPLREDNRALVKLALTMYNQQPIASLSPFVQQFPIQETTFSMTIGPIFNAIGRMAKDDLIQHVVPYLVSEDEAERLPYVDLFKRINDLRKERSNYWASYFQHHSDRVVLERIDDVSGLTGLIASRLLQGPTLISGIFATDEKNSNHLVGSLRSIDGVDVYRLIQSYPGPLVAFGGHPQACGVTLHQETWDTFLQYFKTLTLQQEPIQRTGIPITTREITFDHYTWIQNLAPFGPQFPEPLFVLNQVPVEKLTFTMKSPYYLSTRLTSFSEVFSFTLKKVDLEAFEKVQLFGTFRLNQYRSTRKIQFVASHVISL